MMKLSLELQDSGSALSATCDLNGDGVVELTVNHETITLSLNEAIALYNFLENVSSYFESDDDE